MFERPRAGEKAVLVHLDLGRVSDPEEVEEFRLLARSAGAEIVGQIGGSRATPDRRLFVGTGKADELKMLVEAEQATVGFELGLPRPAQADTALLALQVGPATHQPGGKVGELGQFYLKLALEGTGALGEDVQNEARAIQHPALEMALQVALLAWRQGMVKMTSSACSASTSIFNSSALPEPTKRRRSGVARLPPI